MMDMAHILLTNNESEYIWNQVYFLVSYLPKNCYQIEDLFVN